MARQPKHRFSKEEADAAFDTLTPEEQEEFHGLNMASGMSPVSDARLRELETIAYTRLKEKNNIG